MSFVAASSFAVTETSTPPSTSLIATAAPATAVGQLLVSRFTPASAGAPPAELELALEDGAAAEADSALSADAVAAASIAGAGFLSHAEASAPAATTSENAFTRLSRERQRCVRTGDLLGPTHWTPSAAIVSTILRRLLVCLVVALVTAFIGPRLVGPQSKAAGAPFAYEPPDRFAPVKDKSVSEQGAQVWAYEGTEGQPAPTFGTGRAGLAERTARVHAVLHHSAKEISVDERDLAKLASEMSKAFEDQCTWTHRRHELRTRSDGARVGLIEGDCNRDVDLSSLGLPATVVKQRKLQLIFPDDSGTSIVTASYPTDHAAQWEPVFEATISKAKGVATRVPSPPPWQYGAFGGAGLVLGWLLAALVLKERPAPKAEPPIAKAGEGAAERD